MSNASWNSHHPSTKICFLNFLSLWYISNKRNGWKKSSAELLTQDTKSSLRNCIEFPDGEAEAGGALGLCLGSHHKPALTWEYNPGVLFHFPCHPLTKLPSQFLLSTAIVDFQQRWESVLSGFQSRLSYLNLLNSKMPLLVCFYRWENGYSTCQFLPQNQHSDKSQCWRSLLSKGHWKDGKCGLKWKKKFSYLYDKYSRAKISSWIPPMSFLNVSCYVKSGLWEYREVARALGWPK